MAVVKLTLLENAQNFLNHSLNQAVIAEENPENWKYAILHLVQAIELSLKELLRKEHPFLIFKNIDNPIETVSLRAAAKRLENISKLKFKKEDLDSIFLASKFRNQIVHYEFSFKIEEIKVIYSKLLGFLQSFMQSQFNQNISDIVFDEVWEEALKIFEYAKELEERAKERFKNEKIDDKFIIVCKFCHQKAYVFYNNNNVCYVCGYEDYVEQCQSCEEYFFEGELEPPQEYSDELYCKECIENLRDEYDVYWDI